MHSDSSLIVFFTFMELRGINRFKAQSLFLLTHQDQVKQFRFKSVPDRTTLSRRYKQLAPRIEQFIAYLGDLGVSYATLIQMRVGQRASIADGFTAMDFISQPLPTDFHGSLMFGRLL